MSTFPRTTVGGVSLPRIIIGTNWFLGHSHTSAAKSRLIIERMTRDRIADVICAFLEYGIDATLSSPIEFFAEAVHEAEQRSGKPVTMLLTPNWRLTPDSDRELEPEEAIEQVKEMGGKFCMPHQCTTDAMLDLMYKEIRGLDKYTKMMRDRGLIPGLSTHAPETVIYTDRRGYDIETYIQIYNPLGFMMPIEVDWVMQRVIQQAKKPVLTIKPFAAGRMTPAVALPFVWNTIRDQDMVCIGTSSPDEAKEDVELSLAILERRAPEVELQKTRSKKSLD